MLYFLGGNLQSERFAPAFAHVVEARERVKRKRIAVEVIFQIENARKTRASKFRFIPRAVFILVLGKPSSGALGSRIVRPNRCKQADQSPRGLRCGALAFAFERRVVVGKNRFAE